MSASSPTGPALSDALRALGHWLQSTGYRFTTVTPCTHARVIGRDPARRATSVRDAFGWNLPFSDGLLPAEVMGILRDGALLARTPDGLHRSRVRWATLDDMLFAHAGFPTSEADAVFFGPDTYRFAGLIGNALRAQPLPPGARILDMGCGAGPGGMLAARLSAAATPELVLADINPRALQFAAATAALAGLERVRLVESDLFAAVEGAFDLVVSNPPYLNDAAQRTYRHGGGAWGEVLSERIVREALGRLAAGGSLVLYTGAAMVDGRDPLAQALEPVLQASGWPWSYRELDPDVFGEELAEPAYARAERIAAVALVVRRPAAS